MENKLFSIPISKFTIDTSQDDLAPSRIQVCHDRENPNGLYFELDSFTKAKNSIKNKPIVAAYEINEDIYLKFKSLSIDSSLYIEKRDHDRYGIDLKRANELLAIQYGVSPENIVKTNHCTASETDLFFSYRVEKGNTGRMLAFIGRK